MIGIDIDICWQWYADREIVLFLHFANTMYMQGGPKSKPLPNNKKTCVKSY